MTPTRRPPPAVAIPLLAMALALLGDAAWPNPLSAQTVRYTGSLQYMKGAYVFDTQIHTVALRQGLWFSHRRWDASVSIPLLLHNGGLMSVVGDQWVPTGGAGHGVMAGALAGRGVGGKVQTRRTQTAVSQAAPPETAPDSVLVFDPS
jgi:hypothetical protein